MNTDLFTYHDVCIMGTPVMVIGGRMASTVSAVHLVCLITYLPNLV